MSGLYRDEGVVLRTIKLGETDRIVTLFARASGKVRAVAKGVRKPGSRFGARLEPSSHVAFQCYRGRELDVVTQVETIHAFRGLRERYTSLTHAMSMLEATDQVAQEREPDPALYRMLVGALGTLAECPSPVVSAAYFWKLLALEGFLPVLDSCARCGAANGREPGIPASSERDQGGGAASGRERDQGGGAASGREPGIPASSERDQGGGAASGREGRVWAMFDLGEGGVLCPACARGGGRRVSEEALAVIGRILGGELHRVLAAPPPPDVLGEVERLGVASLEHQSERRLRSAALL